MLMHLMNPKNPAPENLLTLVPCGCTGNCNNALCSCRQARLSCKHCNEEDCSNAAVADATANAITDDADDSEFINIAAELDSEDAYSLSDASYVESDKNDGVQESMEIYLNYDIF